MNTSSQFAFEVTFYLAAFFCNVVFGYVLLFSVVIMPGLGNLDDESFLVGFQAIDGIIQANQPVFLATWMGSFLSAIILTVMGMKRWEDTYRRSLLAMVCTFMVIGHILTGAGNIPLNNRLHAIDIDSLDDSAVAQERVIFERPWNMYNNGRTVLFGLASACLLVLLLQYNRDSDKQEADTSDPSARALYVESQNSTTYQNMSV